MNSELVETADCADHRFQLEFEWDGEDPAYCEVCFRLASWDDDAQAWIHEPVVSA